MVRGDRAGRVLAGPFERRATADVAWDDETVRIRREMERSRRPEGEIALRVAAVTVAYGRRAGAWGGFEAAGVA